LVLFVQLVQDKRKEKEVGTIRSFKDIECWQGARALVRCVYLLSRKEHFKKDFDLVSQIRRSAVSSMANVAEGFHRSSKKDFLKYLDYARSSIAETVSHGYVALDQGYISEKEMAELELQADAVWKKMNAFIAYLDRDLKK
jgi:four helix bundle protein